MNSIGLRISFVSLIVGWVSLYYAEEVTDLDSYPKSDVLLVTVDECTVKAANHKDFRSKGDAQYTILKPHLSSLKQGDLWAVQDKEKVEFEKRVLALEKRIYDQEILKLKKGFDDKASTIEKEVSLKEEEIHKIDEMISLFDVGENLKKQAEERKEVIRDEIKKLQESVNEDDVEFLYDLEKAKLDLEMDKKIAALDKLKSQSELRAPFDGILELNPSPKSIPVKVDVESNNLFATITDDSSYELVFVTSNPILRRADNSDLTVRVVVGQNGDSITGSFLESRLKEGSGRTQKQSIFIVDDASSEVAKNVIGERYTANIFIDLGEECILVKKSKIAFLNTDILEKRGWAGLVSETWPEYQVLREGPYELALKKRN